MYHFKQILLLVFVLVLQACVPQEKASDSSKASSESWTIELETSGGFAGLMQNTSVDSTGLLIINNLKLNKSVKNKLNNKELEKLSGLISQLKMVKNDSFDTELGKTCADCFQYKLSIRWQNSRLIASLNDINLGKSPYKDTVLFLRQLTGKYYIK